MRDDKKSKNGAKESSKTPSEGYSGSDHSGEVRSTVESVSELLEQDAPDVGVSHLEILKRAIDIEEEPNWIALLFGLVGMVFEVLGLSNEARKAYKEVVDVSRPDVETFDDILNVYCQANYRIGIMLLEEERYEEALEAFFRVLPYMTLIFEEEHCCAVAAFVDQCFSELDRSRFALPFAEAAAYYCHGDDLTLKFLAKAYVANGLPWKADLVTKGSKRGSKRAAEFSEGIEKSEDIGARSGD